MYVCIYVLSMWLCHKPTSVHRKLINKMKNKKKTHTHISDAKHMNTHTCIHMHKNKATNTNTFTFTLYDVLMSHQCGVCKKIW